MTPTQQAQRRTLTEIPIGRVKPSPSNPRHEPRDIEELSESIRSVGIIEPLIVAVDPTDPEHVTLVAGSRRFAAAQRAGLKTVPAIIMPFVNERTELAVSLVENLHRVDLSPIEKGEAFEKLVATGIRQDKVGKLCGVSEWTVSVCIRLANELVPEARRACHEGKISMSEAYDLVRETPTVQRLLVQREKPPAIKDARGRKSHAETALSRALTACRQGDPLMALGFAQEAVQHLQARAKVRNEDPPPVRRANPRLAARPFPLKPVADLMGVPEYANDNEPGPMRALANRLAGPMDRSEEAMRQAVYRWARRGLTMKDADEVATALEQHPSVIWPNWGDDLEVVA